MGNNFDHFADFRFVERHKGNIQMVAVQHLIGGRDTSFSNLILNGIHGGDHLSVFNYNILLPNSVDGWWT
jgi:hypothetical protein